MKIDIIINLSNHSENEIDFTINFQSNTTINKVVLNALVIKTGIKVKDFTIFNKNKKIDYSINNNIISIKSNNFTIKYKISSIFNSCVGFNKSVEFIYPFFNEDEIFFGSGSLPYPKNIFEISDNIELFIDIVNTPKEWSISSNLEFSKVSLPILDSFYIYCKTQKKSYCYIFNGKESKIEFQIEIQKGKTIPLKIDYLTSYIDKYCNWLEENLSLLNHIKKVDIFILQVDSDFKKSTNNESMASGENMLNTIILYAPNDDKYYEKIFGYYGYDNFILDAITHELMHFFTTMSWHGKYKSILYPSSICSSKDARFIGESLNIYFHSNYLSIFLYSNSIDITKEITSYISGKGSLLNLFILDRYLLEKGFSLIRLFSELLNSRKSFDSVDILFTTLENRFNISVSNRYKDFVLGRKKMNLYELNSILDK